MFHRRRELVSCVAPMLALVFSSIAPAQVVQLPSVRNFSYSGSAWVPDAGTASLGGNRYSSTGSVSRGLGPYAGRGFGGTSGASSIAASVQIIDLKALDDAILSANVSRDPNATSVLSADSPAAGGGRRFLSNSSASATQGLDGIGTLSQSRNRWQRVLAGSGNTARPQNESLVESDIRFYLSQGKAAEKANRVMAARVYYRMALQAMTPEMLQRYRNIVVEQKSKKKEERDANQPNRVKF